MKKTIVLLTAACIAATISACGSSPVKNEATEPVQTAAETIAEAETVTEEETASEVETETTAEATETVPENGFPLPYGTDTGTGTMHLATPGGTSEDGNIPSVLAKADTSLLQIGIKTSDFDNTHFSYVFIDGILINAAQYGDSQGTINLEADALKEGEHTVSVVQFEGDNSENEVITYKEAKYKIVIK